MPKLVVFDQNEFTHCCGVDEVGAFYSFKDDVKPAYPDCVVSRSGTGMFISTFIDNQDCKDAYEMLSSKHKILFQSEPMLNVYSGRHVFLCVFLHV